MSRIGGIIVLMTLIICLIIGLNKIKLLWIIPLLPSYILGFYLYRIYNNENFKKEFKRKLLLFIIASIITLLIIYYIGIILNFIIY
jgi:4-hydroxybenzoate polyprenyltransferase